MENETTRPPVIEECPKCQRVCQRVQLESDKGRTHIKTKCDKCLFRETLEGY